MRLSAGDPLLVEQAVVLDVETIALRADSPIYSEITSDLLREMSRKGRSERMFPYQLTRRANWIFRELLAALGVRNSGSTCLPAGLNVAVV